MKVSDLIASIALVVSGVGFYFSYNVHQEETYQKNVESTLFTEITQGIGVETLSETVLIERISTNLSDRENKDLSEHNRIKKAIYSLIEREILVFVHSEKEGLSIELRTHLPRKEANQSVQQTQKDTPAD